MKPEQIIEYIESPTSLGKKELITLKELLNMYPYFQTAHLLFIKSAHNIKDVELEHYLVKSSTFINNRSILHDLLAQKTTEYKTEIEKESISEIIPENTEISTQSNQIEEITTNLQDLQNILNEDEKNKTGIEKKQAELNVSTKKDEVKPENISEEISSENTSDNALKAHHNLINDFFKPKVEITKIEQKSKSNISIETSDIKSNNTVNLSDPVEKKKLADDIFARIESLKNEKLAVKTEQRTIRPKIEKTAEKEENKSREELREERMKQREQKRLEREKVENKTAKNEPVSNTVKEEILTIDEKIEIKTESLDTHEIEKNQFKKEVENLVSQKIVAFKTPDTKENEPEKKAELTSLEPENLSPEKIIIRTNISQIDTQKEQVSETLHKPEEKIITETKIDKISENTNETSIQNSAKETFIDQNQTTEVLLEQKIENTPILPEIKDQNTEKKEPVSETKQEKSAAQSIYEKIALFKQKKLQEQEQNKVKIEEIPALDTEMIEQKENTVQDEKSVTNHNDSKEITVPENIEQTPEEALPLHGKITENDIESIETIEETKELESSEIIDENLDENTEKNKKLIDKFIETEPKLDAKKEPELQGDVSKSSTVKKGEIITELMANIYINQAYYDKAIAIFEKLILKYPKKKSYFASKIEDLKKMM